MEGHNPSYAVNHTTFKGLTLEELIFHYENLTEIINDIEFIREALLFYQEYHNNAERNWFRHKLLDALEREALSLMILILQEPEKTYH